MVDEDILQNKPNKGKALFLVAVAGAVLGVGGLWTADLLFERATKSRRMKQVCRCFVPADRCCPRADVRLLLAHGRTTSTT